jgi:2-polyprenyl-3-methyl-5-hydroxy-6-metoxy-1,4-benzoquinol methylase
LVRECTECGATFADLIAEPEIYSNYYRSCSKYDTATTAEEVPATDRRRAAIAAQVVTDCIDKVESVLDLGCGVGTLLNTFRESGATRVCGVDPGANAAVAAEVLYGLREIHVGTWADAAAWFNLARFDAICLTGVLEHLPDADVALATLRRQMRPGAVLLLEVPAAERFMDEPFEPFGEFSLEHLNYFCVNGIRRLASRCGFRECATRIVTVGNGVTASLFALLRAESVIDQFQSRCHSLRDYVLTSRVRFAESVARVASIARSSPFALYGAGSHSARLMAALEQSPAVVVDANPNLHGRSLGQVRIEPPLALERYRDLPVVVSSFRSQAAIAARLRKSVPNPVVTLYEDTAVETGAGHEVS